MDSADRVKAERSVFELPIKVNKFLPNDCIFVRDKKFIPVLIDALNLQAKINALLAEREALWEVVRAGDVMAKLTCNGYVVTQFPDLDDASTAYYAARERLDGLIPTNEGIVPKR